MRKRNMADGKNTEQILREALAQLRKKTDFVPRIALTLGSGLDSFAELVTPVYETPFDAFAGFPSAGNPMHKGTFLFGTFHDIPLVVMRGRLHFYEGADPAQIVLPLRLARLAGAERILLTNAAGGIREDLTPGSFMLIRDHISFLVPSPLRGPNPDFLGERFPDMTEVYDAGLRKKAHAAADRLGIPLPEGVYIQTPGPAFETPAEIRACASMGADAVGMSTAVEAQAAHHCGMKVCGIACISNYAAGISPQPLTVDDIRIAAAESAPRFRALLSELLAVM